MTLDLSALPPARRERIEDAYWRERAAVRIRETYPAMRERWGSEQALDETADAVNAALALPRCRRGFTVSARFVRAVMREGR